VLERKLLDAAALDALLDPREMTKPNSGVPGAGVG
jgi:hypothetical protein